MFFKFIKKMFMVSTSIITPINRKAIFNNVKPRKKIGYIFRKKFVGFDAGLGVVKI